MLLIYQLINTKFMHLNTRFTFLSQFLLKVVAYHLQLKNRTMLYQKLMHLNPGVEYANPWVYLILEQDSHIYSVYSKKIIIIITQHQYFWRKSGNQNKLFQYLQ